MFQLIRKISKPLFIIYLVLLILVIVLKYPTTLVVSTVQAWRRGEAVCRMAPQLVPFRTTIFYVKHVQAVNDWFFKNLACNLIMFMPYGFLLPMFAKKNKRLRVILSGCIVSVMIEIFQYITALGQCDIDDVILNTAGVAIGYFIYYLIYKKEWHQAE